MSGSLEQYVASRYMQDMSNAGYQPVCQNADEMIVDALKTLAAMNQAHRLVQTNMLQRGQATT